MTGELVKMRTNKALKKKQFWYSVLGLQSVIWIIMALYGMLIILGAQGYYTTINLYTNATFITIALIFAFNYISNIKRLNKWMKKYA